MVPCWTGSIPCLSPLVLGCCSTRCGCDTCVVEPAGRQRALELVRFLMDGGGSEEDGDAALTVLRSLVPDPAVSALIFWPSHHKLTKDLAASERTPEEIVELAYLYEPFAL